MTNACNMMLTVLCNDCISDHNNDDKKESYTFIKVPKPIQILSTLVPVRPTETKNE